MSLIDMLEYDDSEPRDEHGMWTVGSSHLAGMKPKEINKELDKTEAARSKHNDKMIKAGRGHETFNDYAKKDDALSKEGQALSHKSYGLRSEIRKRYGASATRAIEKLPKTIR